MRDSKKFNRPVLETYPNSWRHQFVPECDQIRCTRTRHKRQLNFPAVLNGARALLVIFVVITSLSLSRLAAR